MRLLAGASVLFHLHQVASGLGAMPQEKWVLTNCNEKHAKLALQDMALDAHFKCVTLAHTTCLRKMLESLHEALANSLSTRCVDVGVMAAAMAMPR